MSETRYQREIHGRIYHQWPGGCEWIESSSFRLSRRRTKFGRRGGSKSCASAFILPVFDPTSLRIQHCCLQENSQKTPKEDAYNNARLTCWHSGYCVAVALFASPDLTHNACGLHWSRRNWIRRHRRANPWTLHWSIALLSGIIHWPWYHTDHAGILTALSRHTKHTAVSCLYPVCTMQSFRILSH